MLAVLALAGCDVKVGDKGMSLDVARETVNKEWSRSYPLPSGRFELSLTGGGVIEVTGTDGSQLDVRIVQEATAMTKDAVREALDAVSVEDTASADHVSIEVRAKSGGMARGRVSTRATVRLPRGLMTTINARDGEIRLDNVDGTSTVALTNGTISGHGLAGGLTASVANGRLVLDLARVTGPVALTARNGNINLGIATDARANVEAAVVNGRITVDSALPLVSDTPRDDSNRRGPVSLNQLAGRLNGGGPRIEVQATNGAVRFSAPGTAPQPPPRR
jgi:hypothetical protein